MNLKTRFQNLIQSMERRNRLAKDRSSLMNMTDRELSDIGISRLQIDEALRDGKK